MLLSDISAVALLVAAVGSYNLECPHQCYCRYGPLPNYNCDHSFQNSLPSNLNPKAVALRFNNYLIDKVPQNYFHRFSDRLVNLTLTCNGIRALPDDMLNMSSGIEFLDLSNNNMTTLPRRLFSNTTNIRQVNLAYNEILYLPEGIFNNLSKLETLYLNENKLAMIAAWMFHDTNRLLYLFISRNEITELAHNSFEKLEQLEELDLSHNYISSLDLNLFYNTGKLWYIDLTNNSIQVIDHRLFNNSRDISTLNLNLNKISNLDSRVFHNMDGIEELDLSYNAILILYPQLFNNLSNLVELHLSYNKISSIPLDLFKDTYNLISLKLDNNIITKLHDDSFENLSQLQHLYLDNNKLRYLKSGLFRNAHNLIELTLDNNELSVVDYSIFSNLNKLQTLSLSHNTDITVHEIFKLPYNLQKLDLSNINLQIIQILLLNKSSPLSSRNNQSNEIILKKDYLNPSEYNASVDSDISQSQLYTFNKCHTKMSNKANGFSVDNFDKEITFALTHLNLSINSIERLSNIWFTSLVFLESLDISHNRIRVLDPDDFTSCRRMTSLNISNNLLFMIHDVSFDSLSDLSVLDLSWNPSVKFTARILKQTRNITRVNLSGTGLTVRNLTLINELFELPKVPFINIDNNTVCGVRYLETFLLLFFKVYRGEFYKYAMKGHHSCIGTYPNTTELDIDRINMETSILDEYNKDNFASNITEVTCSDIDRIPQEAAYYCSYPCTCKDTQNVYVRVGNYHNVSCRDYPLKTLPNEINPNIAHLDVINCNILTVPKRYFQNMTKLLNLTLSRNNFRSLSFNVFDPLKNLMYLDLSNNELVALSPQIFNKIDGLLSLNLSNNKLSKISPQLFKYLRKLIYLDLSDNSIITLLHQPFDYLTNLEQLRLFHNNIYILDVNTFSKMRNLWYLNLSHNSLMILETDLLKFLSKLTHFFIGHNSISSFECDTFTSQNELFLIDVSYNLLQNMNICVFGNTTSLNNIILSGNLIEELDCDIFTNSSELSKLDLSDNQIRIIPRCVLESTSLLKEIDLSGNRLEDLPDFKFPNLGLTHINLANSSINYLYNDSFIYFCKSTNIDLSRNRISELETIMCVNDEDFEIDTPYDDRKCQYEDEISDCKYWYHDVRFNISHNYLKTLPAPLFNDSARFTVLDMSYNQIDKIPCGLLHEMRSLVEIYLNNNKIVTLCDEPLSIQDSSLTLLDLSYNQIESIQPKLFSSNNIYFTTLNLSFNKLLSLPPNFSSQLPLLRTLDISSNPDINIQNNNFEKLKDLRELIMDNTCLSNRHLTLFNTLFEMHQPHENYNRDYRQTKLRLLSVIGSPACDTRIMTWVRRLFDYEFDYDRIQLKY